MADTELSAVRGFTVGKEGCSFVVWDGAAAARPPYRRVVYELERLRVLRPAGEVDVRGLDLDSICRLEGVLVRPARSTHVLHSTELQLEYSRQWHYNIGITRTIRRLLPPCCAA